MDVCGFADRLIQRVEHTFRTPAIRNDLRVLAYCEAHRSRSRLDVAGVSQQQHAAIRTNPPPNVTVIGNGPCDAGNRRPMIIRGGCTV